MTKKFRTHYDNLQVVENASIEVIKGSYKYLSHKYHPDKNPNNIKQCERNIKIINKAYKTLSDPILRNEHDKWIQNQIVEFKNEEAGSKGSSKPVASKKKCGKCGKTKDSSKFFNSDKNGDGLTKWCRDCLKKKPTDERYKICSKCKKRREKWNFFKSERQLDGLTKWCKPCHNKNK